MRSILKYKKVGKIKLFLRLNKKNLLHIQSISGNGVFSRLNFGRFCILLVYGYSAFPE